LLIRNGDIFKKKLKNGLIKNSNCKSDKIFMVHNKKYKKRIAKINFLHQEVYQDGNPVMSRKRYLKPNKYYLIQKIYIGNTFDIIEPAA